MFLVMRILYDHSSWQLCALCLTTFFLLCEYSCVPVSLCVYVCFVFSLIPLLLLLSSTILPLHFFRSSASHHITPHHFTSPCLLDHTDDTYAPRCHPALYLQNARRPYGLQTISGTGGLSCCFTSFLSLVSFILPTSFTLHSSVPLFFLPTYFPSFLLP